MKYYVYTNKGAFPGTMHYYYDHDGTSWLQRKYYSFEFVPYAQPPVDDLRFANPKDFQTFNDVRKLKEGSREDCLFLHIYTPEVRPGFKDITYNRPVIVFIPSYWLVDSNKLYGPEYLMTEDVVLVMLHYRRDILGFSGFQKPNAELNVPGDAGFQDIIKGFEFVKNEIGSFGGCPDNITAYGQGVSCAYIRLLTVEPHYTGELFHKMILSSSLEHSFRYTLRLRQYDLRKVAKAIRPDRNFDDDKACVEFLRTLPVDDLLVHSRPILGQDERIVRANNLLAVEGDIYRVEMPVLIGFNSMEGKIEDILNPNRVPDRVRGQGARNIYKYLRQLLWLSQTQKTKAIASQDPPKLFKLYMKYPGGTKFSLTMIETDIKYVFGILRLAINLAKYMQPRSVYLYKFSADLALNTERMLAEYQMRPFHSGASHADELGYIFRTSIAETVPPFSVEYTLCRQMAGIWAKFARTGNPNLREDNAWKPIIGRLTNYFEISSKTLDNYPVCHHAFSRFEKERFDYWEKVYDFDKLRTEMMEYESKRNADNEKKNKKP